MLLEGGAGQGVAGVWWVAEGMKEGGVGRCGRCMMGGAGKLGCGEERNNS